MEFFFVLVVIALFYWCCTGKGSSGSAGYAGPYAGPHVNDIEAGPGPPVTMTWKSKDIRRGVTNKLRTKPGQEVDHMTECQCIAAGATRAGATPDTIEKVKRMVNARNGGNLRAASRAENLRTGNEMRNYLENRNGGAFPGPRTINKNLKGIAQMRAANPMMSPRTARFVFGAVTALAWAAMMLISVTMMTAGPVCKP